MTKINIIIPVENYDETEKYYRKIFNFSDEERLFFLPVGSFDVALKLIIISKKSKPYFPPQKRFPIFCYNLEKNFYRTARNFTKMVL